MALAMPNIAILAEPQKTPNIVGAIVKINLLHIDTIVIQPEKGVFP